MERKLFLGDAAARSAKVALPLSAASELNQRYLNELGRLSLLSAEEEIDLGRKVRAGNEAARKRMIESNLRLVVKIARRYCNRGLALMDLVAEGNLGLIHAVDKYDAELGFRFSTYSVPWIRHYIERALMSQGRSVRLPVHTAKEYNAFRREVVVQTQKLQHEPSPAELAQRLGRSLPEVERLLGLQERVQSLHTPLDAESELTLGDVLAGPADQQPAVELEAAGLIDCLRQLVDGLPQREREVMKRRYGLGTDEPSTLEEVGELVGLTRERVRQIQLSALKLLKERMESRGLNQETVFG